MNQKCDMQSRINCRSTIHIAQSPAGKFCFHKKKEQTKIDGNIQWEHQYIWVDTRLSDIDDDTLGLWHIHDKYIIRYVVHAKIVKNKQVGIMFRYTYTTNLSSKCSESALLWNILFDISKS